MAKGRFISKSIADSKRFAKTPERAGILYLFALAHADVEGRLEADDEALLSLSGRYGLERGWSRETVAADREFLARVGLLRLWGSGLDVFAEIVGFFEHNRTRKDREAPSKIPPPPEELPEDSGSGPKSMGEGKIVELPEDSRRTPAKNAGVGGRTPAQVQVQEEVQGEGEGQVRRTPPGSPSPKGDPRKDLDLRTEIAQRLLDAWSATWAKANSGSDRKIAPPTLSFPTAERLAKDVPALVWFGTVEVLADELRRVLLSCEEKGWKAGRAEWVIEKVGQVFEGVSEPNPVTWKKEPNPKRSTVSEKVASRVDVGSIGRAVE